MKKQFLLSLAVVGMLFTSCADTKEKKTEDLDTVAQSQLEVIENEIPESDQNSLFETLQENDSFSTLTVALKATDLDSALASEGPLTIFAPTNEAFEQLGDEKLTKLLTPDEKQTLGSILTYHVVEGDLDATSIIRSIEEGDGLFDVETLQGTVLTFSLEDDKVVLSDSNGNKASVVVADTEAANGVIHSISAVLIPQE